MDGWIEARGDVTCAGCKALARAGDEHGEPGRKLFLVDTMPEGREPAAWDGPNLDPDAGPSTLATPRRRPVGPQEPSLGG